MTKAEMELGVEVIKYTFEKLPDKAQIKLLEELEKDTRKQRWNQVVSKVRSRATNKRISQKEINRVCEQVRQRIYEKRTKGSN